MELKETEEEKDKRGSEKDMASLRRRLQQKLMEEIESRKSVSDEELWELIDRAVLEAGQAEYIPLRIFGSVCLILFAVWVSFRS